MYRSICFAVAVLLFGTQVVLATTFAIPEKNPVATITIPDSWEPETYDDGVEATSKDGDVYIAVESVESSEIGEVTREGLNWFKKKGVKIDLASKTVAETSLDGMQVLTMSFKAQDKDGETEVAVSLIKLLAKNRFLLFYVWGSKEAGETNGAALGKIFNSLSPTK